MTTSREWRTKRALAFRRGSVEDTLTADIPRHPAKTPAHYRLTASPKARPKFSQQKSRAPVTLPDLPWKPKP